MDDLTSRFLVSAVGALIGALSGGVIAAIIASASYRRDRKASAADRNDERAVIAAENVLLSLTPLVTVNPFTEDWAPMLRDFRVRVILYQTVLRSDDAFVADWLMLERHEGMQLFLRGTAAVDKYSAVDGYVDEWMMAQFQPAQAWANATMLLLAGWRRGAVDAATLHGRGAELFHKYPEAVDRFMSTD